MTSPEADLHLLTAPIYEWPARRRRSTGPDVWYALGRGVLRLYTLACVRAIRVHRADEVPAIPKIIAANHPNVSDGFVVPFVFPDRISCLAQANVFDIPVLGRLLGRAGSIPVVPGQSERLLCAAQRKLEQGYSVFICPEGQLNHGGPLWRGRTGTVRLALRSGAPIVPLAFYVPPRFLRRLGARVDGQVRSGRWQVGGAIYVEVGRPWWPSRLVDGLVDRETLRRLTDELMVQIAALARQAEARAAREERQRLGQRING